jgi:hypothetical protein
VLNLLETAHPILEAILGSREYLETIRPDEEKLIDIPGCEFLLGPEDVVIPE